MNLLFYDNASTTRVEDAILETYLKYQSQSYFNPSAPYIYSMRLKSDVEAARNSILKSLNGNGNVIFTSSGTEADNQALFCSKKQKNSKILIASAEHPAVYQTAMELKQRGYLVEFAEVERDGRVNVDRFRKKMMENTDFVSVMHVSNETGAINPIAELVAIAKEINPNVLFHSDGVQAVGKTSVNLRELNVDLYSFSGHKIHAPKGIAALYVKKGVNIRPYLFGGGQEFGLRSSTENVGGIVALAETVGNAQKNLEANTNKLGEIKTRLKRFLFDLDPEFYWFGGDENACPNILTFASKTVRGEVMLHALEGYGIMIGTGSACSSQKVSRRVPEELGVPQEYINGIIRLSFSKFNDISECEYFEKCFKLEYLKLKKYTRG